MDRARFTDMISRSKLASECHELRAQLKEWEKLFAETHSGCKPGKEDIRKNANIAAKYRAYNRTRDALDGKKDLESLNISSPSLHKQKSSSSLKQLKQSKQDRDQTAKKTLLATPQKTRPFLSDVHPSTLDPYDASPASVSPHLYVFKNAIGPTPQRDGKLLGLFDLLSNSGSTSSSRKRKADAVEENLLGINVAQTPSRRPATSTGDLLDHLTDRSGGRRRSRTPASDGKKFLLSQFFATPSTMRFTAIAEEDPRDAIERPAVDLTPLRSRILGPEAEGGAQNGNALETTPAYLRRTTSFNQRLLSASGSNHEPANSNNKFTFASPTAVRRGPTVRPFKGRALSEILRGLRQMEDNDDEDEMDALREIEGNGQTVLIGDSQAADDVYSVGQEPTRTWKKKGRKRTTRRVVMKPTTAPRKPKSGELERTDEAASDEDVAKVDETQIQQYATHVEAEAADDVEDLEPLQDEDHDNKENNNPNGPFSLPFDNESVDPDSNSDIDELASRPPPSKKPRCHPPTEAGTKPSIAASVGAPSCKRAPPTKKERKGTKKGTINPNAHSHQNFRSLKIRNKNSKGKGGGRFGSRGRR